MNEQIHEQLKKFAHIENGKLESLFQQVRYRNQNIYVETISKEQRIFRWSNPFKPIINRYDEYTVHRVNVDGSVTLIRHDYRSLKSYLIGFLEGFKCCNHMQQAHEEKIHKFKNKRK